MTSAAPIHFHVSAPNPDDHLFHVTMTIPADVVSTRDDLLVSMPAWSPGSYLIREYARHIQRISANARGEELAITQKDKATWHIDTRQLSSEITIRYEVFSHELAVRTNHLDDTHGSLNGVSTFLYPHGELDREVHLSFEMPEGWRVFGGLDLIEASTHHYSSPDFNALFDTPVEMGTHDPIDFEVRGVPHQIVLWGEGNYDRDRLREDVSKIVEAHASLFGGIPYEHYTFIVHLTDQGFGGLEHHNSTLLLFPAMGFRSGPAGTEFDDKGRPDKDYLNFLRLVSHEYFHTWNVKRIRPEVLGPFDYQNENYTRDLWTVEGVTSYYENVGLLRAGLIDGEHFLELMARAIHALDQTPGRLLHDLETSSFNAWVKLYRPDEHTRNSSVSYYLKGELVCFVLDLYIRHHSGGERSLDDVLVALWSHYKETGEGYEEGSYGRWIEEATGVDVDALIESYVRSTQEIDWNTFLALCGLDFARKHKSEHPGAWLGPQVRDQDGRVMVTFVPTDSPAHRAGIYAGDELIAIGGWRVRQSAELAALLGKHSPGSSHSVLVARRSEVLEREVTLDTPPPDQYTISMLDEREPLHDTILSDWLGLGEKS